MDFQIPQFIAREPTIVASLTFRQFLTLTVAGLAIFMLFFAIRNFFLFIFVATAIAGVAGVFSFLQIGGQSFPTIFRNFVFYFAKPKIYVWKKKGIPYAVVKKTVEKVQISEEGINEEKKISLSRESSLNKLWTQIETKNTGGDQQN